MFKVCFRQCLLKLFYLYYIIYFSIKLNPKNYQGFNFNSYSRVGLLNEVSGYGL